MKGIVGIFVVGILACVVTLMILKRTASEDTIAIAMGFGDAKNGAVEMNSVVGMFTKSKDPPRVDRVTGQVYWEEWVEDHFQLLDSSRQRVKLTRISNTSVIPDNKVGAGAEFFLSASLVPGEEYHYDYIPIKADGKRFRCVFTAPSEKECRRPNFTLVP